MTDQPNGSGQPGNPGDGGQPGGTQPPAAFDWTAALGDQAKTYEPVLQAKGWKGPADVLAGYVNLEKALGADKVVLPKPDAKPEEWDGVWKKLGRPDAPDGYEFKKPDGFDGYSDEFAGKFRGIVHNAGLNKSQAAALHDWWVGEAQGFAGQSAEAEAARQAEVNKAIETEWGTAKAEKLEAAARALKALGASDEALASIEKAVGSFGGLKLLAIAGEAMREGQLHGKANGPGLEAAKSELAGIEAQMADPKSALMDKWHPDHKRVIARRTELYGLIHAGQG